MVPSKRANDLLGGLFSIEYLAGHSLTGTTSGSGTAKPALDQEVVHAIIGKSFLLTHCLNVSFSILINNQNAVKIFEIILDCNMNTNNSFLKVLLL